MVRIVQSFCQKLSDSALTLQIIRDPPSQIGNFDPLPTSAHKVSAHSFQNLDNIWIKITAHSSIKLSTFTCTNIKIFTSFGLGWSEKFTVFVTFHQQKFMNFSIFLFSDERDYRAFTN